MENQLDVAIATWQPEGILRVAAMNLPRVPGVRYVVSWQLAGPDPAIPASLAERRDVFICFTNERGLGANRANACRHCNAEVILTADDDLTYTPRQLRSVIDTFHRNPEVDLAAFRFNGSTTQYPDQECTLSLPLPKNYYISSVELAFRRRVLDRISFDPDFGIGAPVFQSGEDSKFLLDALKAGLKCTFYPVTICTHDHPSTGDRPLSKGIALASGRLIRMQYPLSWAPRIVLNAWRNTKKGGNFFPSLYHMFRGALLVKP